MAAGRLGADRNRRRGCERVLQHGLTADLTKTWELLGLLLNFIVHFRIKNVRL